MKALDNPVTAPAPPEPAIDDPLSIITRELRLALTQSTSGLSKYKKSKDQKMLWQRFSMALGGGLALIGPMLIMVRNPTGDVAIITTSCCVLGVAVILAFFMNDSQPKDVVACTAAYAAVLVVFVGAGGGSQTGEAQGNGASTS
ncbi:hypothetical protein QBC41DRAFT_321958 [Cercophora samala]|uniref:DUF6594 domain-containing protein n=1 Tax=Cercophora samala TaxID=330535 RepID=A0AA40DC84_9PEZI|nr:hypothetical protein QBC41DRAFT_321958 [Cercophora samala]